MGWQWHQLDHMQIICTLLQTDNHASTPPHSTELMIFTQRNYKLEAKDVWPNINRTQTAERAENAVFVPGDLDL